MDALLQVQVQFAVAVLLLLSTVAWKRGSLPATGVRKALASVLNTLRKEIRLVRTRRVAMRGARPWWEG